MLTTGVPVHSTVQQGPIAPERGRPGFLIPLALAVLALLTFFVYPGHTFLESDSQIFVPVLLHQLDPGLFGQDILIKGVHTTYTVWDELALALHRASSLGVESVLFLLQIGFRLVGLLGVFWLLEAILVGVWTPTSTPGAAGAPQRWLALTGAAVYALGSWVPGPTLLTIEYEPTPRAFALPFVLLGLGLIGRGKFVAAGIAGACAYLLHPPTSLAFWGVYLLAALVHTEDEKRWHGLALLPAAAAALQVFVWLEPLPVEMQTFFMRIDPAWEKLQRLRAPYVFPSDWPRSAFWVHACLAALIAVAYVRLRPAVAPRLRTFLWMLPATGIASVPLTWLFLEKLKWSLMPQLQPMRYTLYLVLLGMLMCYAAGMERALRQPRYAEAGLWVMAALCVGFQAYNLFWLAPLLLVASLLPARFGERAAVAAGALFAAPVLWLKPFGFVAWAAPNLKVLGLAAAFALLLLLLVAAAKSKVQSPKSTAGEARPRLDFGLWSLDFRLTLAAVLLAIGLMVAAPAVGQPASRNLRTPPLLELSAWAEKVTPPNAVFLFADAGRGLEPGVFRYYARRNIYVDWKGGGQVNYFRGFSEEWWQRWRAAVAQGYSLKKIPEYRRVGINYLVFKKLPKPAPGPVVYRNQTYAVVSLDGN
jgi:hypothetical protein